MLVSFEGIPYSRFLWRAVENCEGGGLYADVYLPETCDSSGCPIALMYHGGGFCFGDTHHIFTGHIQYLLDRGFCIVSVEYRLAPHVHLKDQREDWLDAYKWVLDPLGLNRAIGRLGTVNQARVFVSGGSAGGTAAFFLIIDALVANIPVPRALHVIYPLVDFDDLGPLCPVPQVSFEVYPSVLSKLSEKEQNMLKELWDGPIGTAFDHKSEPYRPVAARRIWFETAVTNGYIFTQYLDESSSFFPESKQIIPQLSSSFPPTVLIKAMADKMLNTEQTQSAYDRLLSLGVEVKLIEAEGMEHGDAEEPLGVLKRWGRSIAEEWWPKVYSPALDFCIDKCKA